MRDNVQELVSQPQTPRVTDPNFLSNRQRDGIGSVLTYVALSIGAVVMLAPFAWMIFTSFKSAHESYTLNFLPQDWTLVAYQQAWAGDRIQSMFGRWYLNSILITLIAVASACFFGALAGYAFSKFRFPGREVLFVLVLSTIMVPGEMLILPWFQTIVDLGWSNSYWGLLFPLMLSGFGIFLMRQFINGVPNDLIDAARVDGMSEFRIFLEIILPSIKAAIAALAILTFLGAWNDFLWPIIVTTDIEMWTLAMGIGSYQAELATEINLQMAAATISSVPVIIVFIFFQRQFIEGITLTGIKG